MSFSPEGTAEIMDSLTSVAQTLFMARQTNHSPANVAEQSEIRRIMRRNDLAFNAFILCGLLICILILVAIFW